MSVKKAVLLDFDGTLIDTNGLILESYAHLFKTTGREMPPESEIVKTFGEPLYYTLDRMNFEIGVDAAIEIYRNYQNDRFEELIDIFPGMLEVIIKLKGMDVKLALVTSRLTKSTMVGLNKFDLVKYFDCIVTADDTKKHKPDPEPINIALEKLGIEPDKAIMVGDSMYDILCARNANVESVLVDWAIAMNSDDRTGPNKPDYIIERADDLILLIK